jgi:hypothetical protein
MTVGLRERGSESQECRKKCEMGDLIRASYGHTNCGRPNT